MKIMVSFVSAGYTGRDFTAGITRKYFTASLGQENPVKRAKDVTHKLVNPLKLLHRKLRALNASEPD